MKTIIVAVLLFFTLSCQAQKLPEAPKPKIDHRIFLVGVSALSVAKSFDMFQTHQLLDRGGWENNPSFGRHPSNARLAGVATAYFAAESRVFYFTERNRHAWVRWTGRAALAFVIEEHIRLGVCDSRITMHSKYVKNCQPISPI